MIYYYIALNFSVSGDTQNAERRIIFENNNESLTKQVVMRNGIANCIDITTYFKVANLNVECFQVASCYKQLL